MKLLEEFLLHWCANVPAGASHDFAVRHATECLTEGTANEGMKNSHKAFVAGAEYAVMSEQEEAALRRLIERVAPTTTKLNDREVLENFLQKVQKIRSM